MKPELSVLPNGLRVVTQRMPHVETVSLGVWVGVGARHETPAQHGLAHLFEHMAFKGTHKRTALRIAEDIEEAGGELNAATGLDTTAYYARVLKKDVGLALDILADILLNSQLDADELDKERTVILQEIAAAYDNPEDVAYDMLSEAAYPNQAVGRSILGTPDSVSHLQASDLRRYLAARYLPGDMVVSAAGAVTHSQVVRHVQALFGGLNRGPKKGESVARYKGGVVASGDTFEQTQVLFGFPAPSYRDRYYHAAQVFSGMFGGGMSSRLFQEIREKRGLCYSIDASVWGLKDTGMLTVHAATGVDMVDQLAGVVAGELAAVANDGPGRGEMQRAKAQMQAGLLMAFENSSALAESLARQLLVHNRLVPVEEVVERLDRVSARDIARVAGDMLAAPATVVVVGSGRRGKGQAQRAAAQFAAQRRNATRAVARPLASRKRGVH